MSQHPQMPIVYVAGLSRRAFLRPYLEREMPEFEIVDVIEGRPVDYAVLLSDTDIYDMSAVADAEAVTEEHAIVSDSPTAAAERSFAAEAATMGVAPTILRLPHIVATGMDGFMMRLARGVSRGSFMHIRGNEARLSVVHGVDVAQAVRLTLGAGLTFNVTDGAAPTLHDIAEALAFRLGHKRIFTIKATWARWIYSRKLRTLYTTTRLFSMEKLRSYAPALISHPVTEYLHTHIYDDESL